ncbi:uncharacterized protein V1516DRAFT_683730 [Lipomyces oligophaga]|uniref:uncharacterized protein n=1 Tax=Lipomyces oligophaga TaxID=45792 RepID=UPI0034CD5EBE
MRFSAVAILALAAPALGHFTLSYPTSRGSNHDTQTEAPCGGKTSVVLPRTLFNPDGSPVVTVSSHPAEGEEINLCINGDCSSNDDFNITMVPIFLSIGAGTSCLPHVMLPDGILASNATTLNATLQVKMTSDDGYLYNCADITLSTKGADSSSTCTNSSGVTYAEWTGTLEGSEEAAGLTTDSSSASASSSATASGSSASSSSSSSAGMVLPSTGLLSAVVAVLGFVAL